MKNEFIVRDKFFVHSKEYIQLPYTGNIYRNSCEQCNQPLKIGNEVTELIDTVDGTDDPIIFHKSCFEKVFEEQMKILEQTHPKEAEQFREFQKNIGTIDLDPDWEEYND